jgi:hypothetical protein
VLKVETSRLQYAKNMAKINFRSLSRQNMLKMQKESGLSRKELIKVHSQFVSAYLLQ